MPNADDTQHQDFDAITVESLRQRGGGKWSVYPADVLAAWVAEMDFPMAEPIRRCLARMVETSDVGYPTLVPSTLNDAREAFAMRMQQRFAWSIAPARVEPLVDVVQGIVAGLQVYSEPGDGVVVQPPIYPPFFRAVAETGRRLVANPLVQPPSGRYEIDVDGLTACIDDRTRVLLLCNPQNPTGRVLTRPELEALASVALQRDLVIISDEIHADITYPGHTHIPIASLGPDVAARTVTLTSATKSFSIPGLRFAVAAFGSDALQQRFRSIPSALRGGVNSFGLHATLAAWRDGDPWLARVLRYLAENRRRVAEFASQVLPNGRHPMPEATYLAWIDCRGACPTDDPYRFFLERARVALGDGARFGTPGQGFVRLNFATSRALLERILTRLARALVG